MGWIAVLVLSAAPPNSQFTWSLPSPTGTALLSQTALPDSACALECEYNGHSKWKVQSCQGRATDFNFVSDDCSTAITLLEYPLKEGTPELTPVAMVLVGGAAVREYRLAEVGASARGEGKRFRWLGGAVGEPGVKPHVNAEQTGIEFTTLDGKSRTVRFAHPEDLAPPRAATQPVAPPQPVASSEDLFQFEDDEGATQFVMGLNNVPAKFRKSARPVQSELNVVEGRPPPTPVPSRPMPSAPRPSTPAPTANAQTPRQPEAFQNSCGIYGLTQEGCMGVMGFRRVQPLIVTLPKAPPPKPGPSPYAPPPSPYAPPPSPYR